MKPNIESIISVLDGALEALGKDYTVTAVKDILQARRMLRQLEGC
jgi:hypothetical protein